MQSNHRTQFLFIHPKKTPTELPIEDELTAKVDYIFAQLRKDVGGYRGTHETPYGMSSDCFDYLHATYPIVSNSLAAYYIRFHREDISEKEINWINELHLIFQNPNYYSFDLKPIYYFKVYEKSELGYGAARTYAIKVIGNQQSIKQILDNTFFKALTELEFDELIKSAKNKFNHRIDGCELVEVYDVLKFGTYIPH